MMLQLRATGTEVYAIGVGLGVDIAELASIAGLGERIFYAEDYSALQNIENTFVSAARTALVPCEEPEVTTVPFNRE